MTVQKRSVTQARAELPDLVRQAAEGQRTVVLRHGRPVAAIVPAGDLRRLEELERPSAPEERPALPAEPEAPGDDQGAAGPEAAGGLARRLAELRRRVEARRLVPGAGA